MSKDESEFEIFFGDSAYPSAIENHSIILLIVSEIDDVIGFNCFGSDGQPYARFPKHKWPAHA